MAENDRKEQVIGVAFDGTGYGTDGTIWGGELLLADYHGFERMGSIEPFLQIGGDISAKEGWRIAVSLIYQQTQDKEQTMEIVKKLNLCSEPECKVILAMADRKMNAVLSTSAGRLFDAVSAILGIRTKSTFEGEASMALEFAAETYEKEIWEIDEPADGESTSDEEKERAGRQDDYEDRKPYKISDREENRRHSGRKISLYLSSKAGRPYNLWLQEDQKENKM